MYQLELKQKIVRLQARDYLVEFVVRVGGLHHPDGRLLDLLLLHEIGVIKRFRCLASFLVKLHVSLMVLDNVAIHVNSLLNRLSRKSI